MKAHLTIEDTLLSRSILPNMENSCLHSALALNLVVLFSFVSHTIWLPHYFREKGT